MKSRRGRYAVLVLTAILIGACAYELFFARSITDADLDRIRSGMTLDEVITTLGSPPTRINGLAFPANSQGTAWDEIAIPLRGIRSDMPPYRLDWLGGGGTVIVYLDETRHVCGKGYLPDTGSVIDEVRRWWARRFGTPPPF
jgi:hypothetical protein